MTETTPDIALPDADITRISAAAAGLMAALHAACFDDPWSERLFASLLHMPGGFGLLARTGEAPVGFALVRVAADEAELLTIGVTKDARQTGFGRNLLHRSCEEAQRAGAGRLYLDVAVSNQPARILYTRAGFAEIGRRPKYYRNTEDALVLARELSSAVGVD